MKDKFKVDKNKWMSEIVLCVAKYIILPFALQITIFTPNFGLNDVSLYYSLVGVVFVWKLHFALSHPPRHQTVNAQKRD